MIVTLPLMPDHQHCHDLGALDLVERNVTAGTKRNDDFAEKRVGVLCLVEAEGHEGQTTERLADGIERPFGQPEGLRCPVRA